MPVNESAAVFLAGIRIILGGRFKLVRVSILNDPS